VIGPAGNVSDNWGRCRCFFLPSFPPDEFIYSLPSSRPIQIMPDVSHPIRGRCCWERYDSINLQPRMRTVLALPDRQLFLFSSSLRVFLCVASVSCFFAFPAKQNLNLPLLFSVWGRLHVFDSVYDLMHNLNAIDQIAIRLFFSHQLEQPVNPFLAKIHQQCSF
jgi:hypothetical protein